MNSLIKLLTNISNITDVYKYEQFGKNEKKIKA